MKTDAVPFPAVRSRANDFVALAKPRLNVLVVASSLAGYVMGGGDVSNTAKVVLTVVGTALVAGGASAFNQVIERNADSLMRRTRLRPVPDGRLQPAESLVFATALSITGLLILGAGVNLVGERSRPSSGGRCQRASSGCDTIRPAAATVSDHGVPIQPASAPQVAPPAAMQAEKIKR